MKKLSLVTLFYLFFFISSNSQNWLIFDTINSPIPDNRVSDIKKDNLGNFWFATSGGLAKYDVLGNWTVYTYQNSNIEQDGVKSVAISQNNDVWIGYQYSGVAKLNGSSFINYDLDNILNTPFAGSGRINGMDFDKNGNLWIAAYNGLIKYDNSTFFRYHNSNGLIGPNNRVWSVLCDTITDIVWAGTFDAGLLKFNGQAFTQYEMEDWSQGLIGNQVNKIYFDTDRDIWISGYGVVEFDKTSMTKKSIYTSNNGLGDPLVWGISIDQNNKLWVGSDFLHGLFMKSGNTWTTFDASNSGLPASFTSSSGLPCNHLNSIYTDAHNNKWFATWSGVVIYRENGVALSTTQNSFKQELVDIYPNPTTDFLFIGSSDMKDLYNAELVDLYGKKITVKIDYNRIDLSEISAGSYLLSLFNNKSEKKYSKIIIKL